MMKMMRRNITKTLAAAMVTAIAACTNSPVLIDTEFEDIQLKRPDEGSRIEFSTFADRSTRAAATVSDLEFYHQTFKVYATKTSDEGNKVQPIFEGVTVTANIAEGEEPNTWEYDTDRYWDKQADNYQFVAYAPAHAPLAYDHNFIEVNHANAKFFSQADYTLIGQNLQEGSPATAEKNTGFTGATDAEGNTLTDCDVMRSDAFPVLDPATAPVVTLNFSHTLAKLLVTVKANAATPYTITVTGVKVDDLLSTGAYDHTKGWEAKGTALVDYAFTTPATSLSATDKTYFVESLMMPQAVAATQVVTLNYTITSGTYNEQFTYVTTLADVFNGKASTFDKGNSYTVNFNIAPENNIITFDAGITTWVDNGNEDDNDDENDDENENDNNNDKQS